jgi:glutamine amidotransferase
MIVVVDYGMGNLGSIINMFKKIGAIAKVSSDIMEIEAAKKILLPGVGAFDGAMSKISEKNLLQVLNYKALEEKVPFLGICLGMQLLTKGSEEGNLQGLSWIDAHTCKFKFEEDQALKIPHMGWNEVHVEKEHPLVNSLPKQSRFYFVHSYYVKCNNENDKLLTSNFGVNFTCAVQHENIMGVQFHPEKSHKFGMELLKNFNAI